MMAPGHTPVRTELEQLVRTGVSWGRDANPAPGLARRAAVLVLFGNRESAAPAPQSAEPSANTGATPDDLDLLFVERAVALSHHPGQIAFPGGRLDPVDSGPVAAALREAKEETGLDPAGVDVVGTLSDLLLPVSSHIVTPVLGWWAQPSSVGVVDPAESAAVFRVPIAELVAPWNRRNAVVWRGAGTAGAAKFTSPAFIVGDRVIWGFTGFVLDGLFDTLGWAQPWVPEEIEIPT